MKKFKIGDILKPAIILTVICLVTSALLGFTNDLTKDQIKQLELETAQKARLEVLSSANSFSEEQEHNGIQYSCGLDEQGNTVGYVFTCVEKGYGGDIKVMVGVAPDGTVLGTDILDLSETPGLGMKADTKAFLDQFLEKTLGIEVVKNNPGDNQIQALTGATITSKAVTQAVNNALACFAEISGGAK